MTFRLVGMDVRMVELALRTDYQKNDGTYNEAV